MQENIDVTVRLADQLSRPANRAEESIEDLRDEVRGLNRDLAAAQAQTARQEAALAALQAQTRRTSDDTNRSRRSTDDSAGAASRSARAHATLTKVLKGTSRALGVLAKVAGVSALLTIIPLVLGLLNALGAASVAAVAGLAPLVGLLGAAPGIIGGFVLAMAAVKLGLTGVGDAVKQLNDPEASPEQVAEAMNKLTDAGRGLATMVAQFADGSLARLKERTQDAIAPGFEAALRTTGTKLMPLFTRTTEQAGAVLGELANRAASVYATPFFRGQLGDLMRSSVQAIRDGGTAAIIWSTALVGVGQAFAPVLADMGEGAVRAAEYVAASVNAGRASGGLTSAFERSWEVAKNVWDVMKDVGVAVYEIGKAGMDAASQMGTGFGTMVSDFREFVTSVEGQESLRKWFADALPVITQLGGVIGALALGIGQIAASGSEVTGVLSGIREALPSIADLLAGIFASSAELTGSLVEVANEVLQQVTPAFTELVDEVLQRLIPALDGVGPPLADIGSAVVSTAGYLAPLLSVLQALGPILDVIAFAATGIAFALEALPGPAQTAVVAIGAVAIALRFFSGSAIAGAIGAIGTQFMIMGTKAIGAGSAMGAARLAASGFLGLVGGPIGLAIVGVTAGLGLWAASSAKAKRESEALAAAQDQLRASLDQVTGAVTEQTRAQVANSLQDKGILDFATKYGVSSKTIVDAVTQEGGAMEDLKAQVNDAAEAMTLLNGTGSGPGSGDIANYIKAGTISAEEFTNAITGSSAEFNALAEKVGGINVLGTGVADLREIVNETGLYRDELSGLMSDQKQVGDAVTGAGQAMVGQRDAALAAADEMAAYNAAQRLARIEARGLATATGAVVTQMTKLNNEMIKNLRTMIGFKQTMADASKVLKEGKRTLNLNTQAGRDNASALADIAESAANVTNKAQRMKAIQQATDYIRDWARSAGMGKKEADRYADSFFNLGKNARAVPDNVTVDVKTPGLTQSEINMRNFKRATDDIPRNITTTVTVNRTGDFIAGGRRMNGSVPVAERYAGGYVGPGSDTRSWVGEHGPELLVGRTGKPMVVGARGPEIRDFSTPGYVVPNTATPESVRNPLPSWVKARLSEEVRPAASAPAPTGGGGSSSGTATLTVPDINITLAGSELTAEDVKAAALAAWREFVAEQEERS